jgi:signal transduction histidine kinase
VQLLYGWFRRHPVVTDVIWPALLYLTCLLEFAGERDLVKLAVSTAVCVLVVFRRRRPDLAAWGGIAIGLGQLAGGVQPTMAAFGYLFLAYSAAVYATMLTSRAALLAGLLSGPLTWYVFGGSGSFGRHTLVNLVVSSVFSTPFLLCWVLGRFTRIRRAYYAELEDRAARLERERDAQAQVAVAAERARIARELHDVVAHNVSVMIVQADGASFVMDAAPEQAKEALATISSTGRQALEEMRRLLGILRTGGDSGSEYVPQPGVEQLPELLEQVRSAGLPVAFTVEGEPRDLPRGVELTAYRIVQEALTNARKHGGPEASARVRIRFDDSGLDMLIEDNGRGASAQLAAGGGEDGFGHGLIGMRERVGMVGGTLEAGPRLGGGFRIQAVLPLKPAKTAKAARTAKQPTRPADAPTAS